ncbi:MAG: TIGR00725 family protein [Candidatus Desulfofervidaceae bacterium]|nr:TIGR00725 family protein [Candidatus Desulfofervidaceae bacterium]
MKQIIGVIGAGICDQKTYELAIEVGRGIAKHGCVLVCGGLGGVMEGAAKGAKEAGGITVGILPGFDSQDANPYIDIPVVTGVGHARNVIIVRTAAVLIAIAGNYGTLSEIAVALKMGKPVVGLRTWPGFEEIHYVSTPEEAITKAISLILPQAPHCPYGCKEKGFCP